MNEDVVRALALELADRSRIRWWVFDLASPNLLSDNANLPGAKCLPGGIIG
jgi:hypothetical protein